MSGERQERHIPSATHLAEFVALKSARRPACVRKHYRQVVAASDQRQFAYFYGRLFAAIRRHVRSGFTSDDLSRALTAATPQQRPSFEEVAEGLVPALRSLGAVDGRTARNRRYYDDHDGEHLVSVYPQFVLTLQDHSDMFVHVHTAKEPLTPGAAAVVLELLSGAYPGERVAVIDARRGAVMLPQSRGVRASEAAITAYLDAYLTLWETAA
ncbi:hypothetical protein [Microbacterium sp. 2MCAF23]|uniref:hypothetical protein n=1 Tax=Microbacterium sp. 2MCAF23 TaxID=3232985 RepID=UPI003F9D9592